jgi:hypothetical protein
MPPKGGAKVSRRPTPEEWAVLKNYEKLRKLLMEGENKPKKPIGRLCYGLLPSGSSALKWPMVVAVAFPGESRAQIYRWDYSPYHEKKETGGLKDARLKCRDCNAVVSVKSGIVKHRVQTRVAHKGKPCSKTRTGHAEEAMGAVTRWAALRAHVEGIARGIPSFSLTDWRKWMALAVHNSAQLNYEDLDTVTKNELTKWASRLTDPKNGNLEHFIEFFAEKMVQGERVIHKLNGLPPWKVDTRAGGGAGTENPEPEDEEGDDKREGEESDEEDEEDPEREEDGVEINDDTGDGDEVSSIGNSRLKKMLNIFVFFCFILLHMSNYSFFCLSVDGSPVADPARRGGSHEGLGRQNRRGG